MRTAERVRGGGLRYRSRFESLHLARWEAKTLTYVGKVGTGFSRRAAYELHQLLQPLATTKPVVKPPAREPQTTWVRPELAVNVEYRTITSDGLLRHASYKGLARTKKAWP